jgi:hypothetical protein
MLTSSFKRIFNVGVQREKQIKLIGLNEHTQQIGSSRLIGNAARMLFAVTVCALRE